MWMPPDGWLKCNADGSRLEMKIDILQQSVMYIEIRQVEFNILVERR